MFEAHLCCNMTWFKDFSWLQGPQCLLLVSTWLSNVDCSKTLLRHSLNCGIELTGAFGILIPGIEDAPGRRTETPICRQCSINIFEKKIAYTRIFHCNRLPFYFHNIPIICSWILIIIHVHPQVNLQHQQDNEMMPSPYHRWQLGFVWLVYILIVRAAN